MPLAQADAFRIPLADKSVHMIATSTPYFGLRLYDGVLPTVFGGRADCEHVWVTDHVKRSVGGERDYGSYDGAVGRGPSQMLPETAECSLCCAWRGFFGGGKLHDCLAWARGEPPCGRCFVCHFRSFAKEAWRVLRDDGTCWLVIADSYAGNRGNTSANPGYDNKAAGTVGANFNPNGCGVPYGLKPKDKVMIPERVRLALQADGWYVRSVAPWIKANPMPNSYTDRPGDATEDVILLAKSRQYFYDHIAVRKQQAAASLASQTRGVSDHHKNVDGAPGQPPHGLHQSRPNLNADGTICKQDGAGNRTYTGFNARWKAKNLANTFARPGGKNTTLDIPGQTAPSHRADRDDEVAPGRNRRTSDWFFEGLDEMITETDDWLIYAKKVRDKGGLLLDEDGNPLAFLVNPHGYKGAHYAVYPEALVTPMILAGTSEAGVCPKCGNPWERVIEKGLTAHDGDTDSLYQKGMSANRLALLRQAARERGGEYANGTKTVGWRPTCDCIQRACPDIALSDGGWDEVIERTAREFAPVPALVLDPFVGSGTTVEAARKLGRIGVGLDISLTYLRQNALPRAERTNTKQAMEELPLFALPAEE